MRAVQSALELDPGDGQAWNGLAATQLDHGCDDEARAALLECLAIDPRMIQARGNMMMLAMRAGDVRGVAEWAERVLEIDPGQTPYRSVYAEALGYFGEMERSRDQYGIVVALAPERAEPWLYYAQALAALGEFELASAANAEARALNSALEGLAESEAAVQAELESHR